MATTYNFTNASIAGVDKPPEHTPIEDRLFIRRNIIDFSKQSLDAGSSDVAQCVNVPAGTLVIDAWVRVITAETANGTVDLGYGSNANYWGNALAIDATGVAATILIDSSTWDASSLNDGQEVAVDITVDGAVLGDIATASIAVDVADLMLVAEVTAANTVTLQAINSTGGAIDLASATYQVVVDKAPLRRQPLYFSSADTIDVTATTDVADVDIDGAKIEVSVLCLKMLDAY